MDKWLQGVKPEQKVLLEEIIKEISEDNPEISDTLSEKLVARSWGNVCRDINETGISSKPEDILKHLSGDLFMQSMTAEGDTVIVSRRIALYEEGSNEYDEGVGMLDKLYGIQNRLVTLSDVCSRIAPLYREDYSMVM